MVFVLAALFVPLGVTPAKAAAFQVMMQGYAFSPAALTVHVGDTVTWMQHDEAPHDATTTSAPVSFRSPSLSSGQSWSYTFRTPGTYAYYCSVHPDMRATVTVLPAPAPAAPPAPPKPAPAAPAVPRKTAVAPPPAATPGASPPPTQPVPAGQPTPSASAAPAPSSAEAVPQQAAAPVAAAPTPPSLDPMLLVAGVVTAVAILCLLLLGSRPGRSGGA